MVYNGVKYHVYPLDKTLVVTFVVAKQI